MADKAYITPKVLRWARESARMSEEVAAAKVSVTTEKLREWEEGASEPTIKQAQTLAKSYKRPFALFFLSEIPNDFQPLQDFRRIGAKPLGTSSVFILREIQLKQAWISDVNKENKEDKVPFIGRYSIKDDPIKVANDILGTLNIHPSQYRTELPIKEWIDKAEAKGVFISRTSFIHSRMKLDSDEIQGFAIADPYAPFVFINSDDWNAPQLFTLVHELAHLWIARTGISNEVTPEINNQSIYNPVELFCNEVAANALIPADIINSMENRIINSAKDVFTVSKRFGVSSYELISLEKYREIKIQADIEFKAFLKKEEELKARRKAKENKGGPNYYLLQLNRNSRLFTQTVLDAYRGGYIEPTQASSLLNVQVNKFPKLEAQLYK
jgi:Zn-dependent peptidase ImmA (M78 family)/transcriptional regulator with XRE-family HTH domain